MKKLLLPLLLLLFMGAKAQNGFTTYSCTITGGNLLFLNRSALAIDNAGNKWIGFKRLNTSSKSLIKFDGTNWTDYTSSINAPVLSLAADGGNIWIGTLNAGLIKYDGSTFTSYTRSNSGIISDTITSLAVVNGNVYAGSAHGFSEFNGTTFTNYTTANSGLSSNNILCFEQEGSQIWIGTASGLNKLNGGTINYIGGTDQVNDIMVDGSSNKWLATEASGLLKYDNATISPLSLSTAIVGGRIPSKLKSIAKSINNNPIVNTEKIALGGGAYQKNGLIELLPGGSYRMFFHSLILVGDAIFGSDINGDIYFIDSKLGAATGLNPKKCLFSFNQNQYFPSASITFITPENTQFLDINNVSAGCNPGSDIHWDGTKSLYEVPKGSGSNATFSTAFWMGGYVNGQLRTAANTYRQTGVDFWPGPINTTTGTTDSITAQIYNRVWKVNRFDIENFKYNFLLGNVQNGTFPIANEILTWPGNGDIFGEVYAPYFDYNNDMTYDPHDGDYPLIKGDQMLWWVFNDALSNHTETGSLAPMQVQVQVSAYAYTCPALADSDKVLNYTTFYNYKVINKSTNVIDSLCMAIVSDADLGNYNDDYVGCDVQNNFAFIYNGDNYDDNNNGVIGYHDNTPYFSYNLIQGPNADLNDGLDNDHDGCIDCTYDLDANGNQLPTSTDDDFLPERMAMSTFLPYNNTGDARTGNPTVVGNGIQYYRYMNSLWKDGTPLRYDQGTGTSPSGYPCDYLYPGSSDPIGFGLGGTVTNPAVVSHPAWTENNAGNAPGDRRFLVSTGKFTLQPGGQNEFDFAYVFTQDSASLANGILYGKVVSDNRKIKNWFTHDNAPSCLDLNGIGLKDPDHKIQMLVFPNPASSSLTIDAGNSNTILDLKVYDILGKEVFAQKNIRAAKSQLNINSLNSGVYLLEVQSEQGAYFTKFVKQ
jgi:hypothetical protein